MKKTNIAIAVMLSIAVLFGATIPVNAASAEVTIEVKETKMDGVSVTVPSTLPIVFNEDGTNTLPTNWTIENISTIAGIHLAQIEMDGTNTGWKLLSESEDTKTMNTDVQSLKFYTGIDTELKLVAPTSGTEHAKGAVSFSADEISIASGEEQTLLFRVDRGAFTSSKAAEKAFDMVLTFEFN